MLQPQLLQFFVITFLNFSSLFHFVDIIINLFGFFNNSLSFLFKFLQELPLKIVVFGIVSLRLPKLLFSKHLELLYYMVYLF
jgi:hypothetical protein